MIILIVVAFLALLLYSALIYKPKNFPPVTTVMTEIASSCTEGVVVDPVTSSLEKKAQKLVFVDTLQSKCQTLSPPCLPVVGSIPFIPAKHVQFTMVKKWKKEYGPVVGLMLGSQPAIAVVGAEEVLEVFRRDEFQGRPDTFNSRDRAFNKRLGFFFTDGPFWVEQRRFTLRHLRDLGFGKKSLEGIILEEAEVLIKKLQYNEIQRNGFFGVPAINILWAVLGGERHSHDDKEFKALLQKITRLFRTGNPSGDVVDVLPFLRRIFPSLAGYRERNIATTGGQDFFRESIRQHAKTLDENESRDFIDVYLKEMKKNDGINNTSFTEDGLVTILLDLFSAGAESVANSLDYCILYLILNPHIQKKVQDELDAVVGRSRRPSLDDRPRLPYVEATLTEVLRINPIAPLTPHHRVMKDTHLNGYDIPKDTTVIICSWSVLSDPDHWGDPEVFRPERFLDSNGKFMKDDWMINFGSGKRFCLGESLARNILFIFFATFFQEFSLSIPEADPKPNTMPQSGFTTAPYPFRMKIKQRL